MRLKLGSIAKVTGLDVFRAKLMLLLVEGLSYRQTITALGTTEPKIAR